jgi:hypothetical protein
MAMLAMSFPIMQGKTKQFQDFIDQINGPRYAEFTESRRRYGVHERTFLQHTSMGDLVVVTLEGSDPAAAFAAFGKSTDPFAIWFKAQVKEIHGLDLAAAPPFPLPTMIVDSAGQPETTSNR